MSWMRNVLIAIDQLGNTIAGGDPDVTVSARVAYNADKVEGSTRYYWVLMELIINYTFYPVDGPDHCQQAYLADSNEAHQHGSDFMRFLLGFFIIVGCVVLAIITRVYVLLFPRSHFGNMEAD